VEEKKRQTVKILHPCPNQLFLDRQMQRSVNLILGTGKMKTKPGQNTNEFNCVDSMVPLIWTPVIISNENLVLYQDNTS
jgi:hypothetical protein